MPQDDNSQKAKIKQLNDSFRRTLQGGQVLITNGVQALPDESRGDIVTQVRLFDAFNEENDPYGEHDFGSIEHDEHKVFWKIDYYDSKNSNYGSEDPANPEKTNRVMTIMLANEY